ncbi:MULTISPECIES: DASS family sodium-coupled anion symporter [Alysiella]|uniref:Inner membrane protein ybhI n=2 Tax=Alysiella TaxID=194195 RepID=A0A376BVR7_9NEIS|nr:MULTISPECIES: DASS family sodium-coupled anion symporter [Alysiella]QMT30634.1 DASS family sodium-coupled anion symporter [Alysiella filiformis]UBQ56389.1 anion permease [Alysiella filiformis DSM 16848]UOP06477.1 anion permease [Alysiella crassa]SOD68454.1 divalent anion:Na+ symporter, DASS family [Alysiella filiformis DSM 16848]SSY81009.1 Inner membrane protein ybhI [Alysiella crassa]
MKRELGFKPIPTLIAIALALIIWFSPIPEGVSPQGWHLLAMFVGVIAAIIGKAMPIGAMSIVAVMLVAVSGVTADKPSQAIDHALSSYANSLIWLIGIAIMISRGLLKTGLGARIAYLFIAVFGKKTLGIGYSLALSELLLAPVTPSNTARGGAIMHPIMKSIAGSYDSDPEKGTEKHMGKYLALVNYHSNPISSTMFITATAPNPLVVNLIAEVVGSDFRLSWGAWAWAMLVPGLVAFALMPLVLYWLYPPEIKETPNAVAFAKEKLAQMGKMSLDEKIMLAIFVILLLLWAGVPEMLLGKAYAVNATATAFIGLSLLLLSNVLTWDDILKEKSAWDTIIWFGALIMMATYLNKLGVIKWFSGSLETTIGGFGVSGMMAGLLLVLAYMYAHYFFASTTAHITAMFGAFLGAAISLGSPPMLTALMFAAASSLMMSLTHYATGTSPVVFGSGYTTMGEWWKAGFIMSVVNFIVFAVVGGVWWKILNYW